METNVNYTLVGAFVLILTTIFVLGIIWLSAGFSTEEFKIYQVNMKESISGLSKDGPVEFNGVNVGTVFDIQIDQRNSRLVILLLKVKEGAPVTRGTRAKLDVRTLSGIAYIALEDKGSDRRPLVALPGQIYPVIETTPSLFVRLDTALTQLNESFHQLSISVSSLLDKENLKAFKDVLHSTQDTLQALRTETLPSATEALKTLQLQTIPAANQAISHMTTIMNNLSDVSTEIKQNPSVLFRGKTQTGLGPGEK